MVDKYTDQYVTVFQYPAASNSKFGHIASCGYFGRCDDVEIENRRICGLCGEWYQFQLISLKIKKKAKYLKPEP